MSLFAQPIGLFNHYYFFKNPNAFSATVLSTGYVPLGTNPFVIEEKVISPVSDGSGSKVALAASIANQQGIFLIDFNSDKSVTWASNCTTSLIDTGDKSCENAPTFMHPLQNSNAVLWKGSYQDSEISGFQTNGQIYQGEICLANTCRV